MALSKIPSAGFQDNVKFRNILINGSLDISQRSTSTSSITGSGYHTVDRFKSAISSCGTWTQSQSTDVPTGQGFTKSLKMDCTSSATPPAGDYCIIQQLIEGQNLQYLKKGTSSAESLTLSFWVKSNKTGTYIAELFDGDNSRHINKSYTISSASTWEKKTITFAGDTTGAFDNDSALSLELNFWLGAGTNFTSGTLQTSWGSGVSANRAVGNVNLADSTSNEWYITGVQLEASQTASQFEFLPPDINLQRCERYCRLFGSGVQGVASGTTAFYFSEPLQPAMRATPTLTIIDTSIGIGNYVSYDKTSSNSTLDLARSSRTGIVGRATGFSGMTNFDSIQVWHNLTNSTATWLRADAEL